MLNLLGDVCRGSQNVTDKESSPSLCSAGLSARSNTLTPYIEVGASASRLLKKSEIL